MRTPNHHFGGLGPQFNQTSCAGCHIRNGRGMPVIGASGTLRSDMLVRISIESEEVRPIMEDIWPAPQPIPGLGLQIQDHANFGVAAEAKVILNWEEISGQYPDGSSYQLRRPRIVLQANDESTQKKLESARMSRRQSQALIGLGLLEAVPESLLEQLADPFDKDQDGISGRINWIWDEAKQSAKAGRFGWKASHPSLLTQTAAAFAEDMGIGNSLVADQAGNIDLDDERLYLTNYYVQTLAVPDHRSRDEQVVLRGEKIFYQLSCANCHLPHLQTDDSHPIAALRQQHFSPYTDLLLHDMGEDLADERRDHGASGREWRTATLWGIGLSATVLPARGFLHDGRARSVEEAILWHGGEAQDSQQKFMQLPAEQRQDLSQFLQSL